MGYIDFGTGGGGSGSDIQFGKTISSADDMVYMHLDNTGNVGIGTVSPASMLHIHSGTPRITMSDSDTGAHHRINADSGAGNLAFDVDYSSTTSTPAFIVNIKGDEKFRVTSAGDVGIGTFNPTGASALTNNNSTLAVGIVTANEYFGTFKGTIDSGVAIENANNVNITNDEDIGNVAHYIHFGDATTGYDGVKVDSTGLVYKDSLFGVGTDSPDRKLHVVTTSSSAIPLLLERTHTNNTIIEYKNSTSSMYAGLAGNALGWGVGTGSDLGSATNNKSVSYTHLTLPTTPYV